MTETLTAIKKEVWTHFKDTQWVFLATGEADQPRVRPAILLNFDKKFWIATNTRSGKARQIRRNPNVEFCLPLETGENVGHIRIAGIAATVQEKKTREEIGTHFQLFDRLWAHADDPRYTLLRITRLEVEFLRPGDEDAYTFLV